MLKGIYVNVPVASPGGPESPLQWGRRLGTGHCEGHDWAVKRSNQNLRAVTGVERGDRVAGGAGGRGHFPKRVLTPPSYSVGSRPEVFSRPMKSSLISLKCGGSHLVDISQRPV